MAVAALVNMSRGCDGVFANFDVVGDCDSGVIRNDIIQSDAVDGYAAADGPA